MCFNLYLTCFLFCTLFAVSAQELPLILDKPGTFEILNRTDYAGPDCNFTKAEITSNLQKINEMVAIVRKNQVLTGMKGFDGRARIYTTVACQYEGVYGVPVRVSFEFAAWVKMKDGREARNLIEPPEWSLHMNSIQPGWTSGFSRKPDFYAVAEKKETIAPGIDVYDGECFVIYNPERRTQEYLQKNSISYHCARFEESLDIEFVKSILPLISK